MQTWAFPGELRAYKIESQINRRDLFCRLAFSPRICTDGPTGTRNYSRRSSVIAPPRCSSVGICFLVRRSQQFNPERLILFTNI